MTNQRFRCSKVLALVLPATLALACGLKRDWSVCSPQDKCAPGYTCTDDYRCVREVDGGSDGLVAVDSQGARDTAGGGADLALPAGSDGPGGVAPDTAGSPALPDAVVNTSPGVDSSQPDTVSVPTPADALVTVPDAPVVVSPPDAPADAPGPTVDAAGTCSTDKDCLAQSPLCLGNRCAKCFGDNDCVGRTGTPVCAASGSCVACTAGSRQCSLLQPQVCSAAGQWQASGSPCPSICNGGTCAACAAGAQQCNGLQPQTCSASGAWQNNGSACPYLCNNVTGACAGACKPTSVQCNGLQPQTCNSSGAWENSGSACPYVCNSATGACSGACAPGAKQCSGSQPQTCDANGVWQNSGSACSGCYTCSAATGTCAPATGTPCDDGNACTSGETCQAGVCTGGTQVTCPAPATCRGAGTCDPSTGKCNYPLAANNSSCDDGNACTTDSCQGGVCVGAQIYCNSSPACRQNTTCSAGSCNYTQNVPDGTLDSKCSSSTPRCYSGGCVQCTSDADCTLPTVSCKPSTHTCVCRLPSSGNVITNPGFEGSLSGWTIISDPPSPTLGADSDGCPGSNSLYVTNSDSDPQQCVGSLTAGSTYYMGGRFKGGTSNDFVRMRLCTGSSCAAGTCDLTYDVYMGASANWTTQHTSFVIPAGYVSGRIEIYALGDQFIDQLYVNKISDSF